MVGVGVVVCPVVVAVGTVAVSAAVWVVVAVVIVVVAAVCPCVACARRLSGACVRLTAVQLYSVLPHVPCYRDGEGAAHVAEQCVVPCAPMAHGSQCAFRTV